jgi:transposase
VERLHVNMVRELIHRLRAGDSERRIATDVRMSRKTVHKYYELAIDHGLLNTDEPLPDDSRLLALLGEAPRPPQQASSLEAYRDTVVDLLAQGVEMTALYDRLRDNYGYTGSYSAVRRFVHRLCPVEPTAVVRVHCGPGEEAQVDFGAVGKLYDPAGGRLRTAYVFVATLSYSRHQYTEFVFDQTTPTWLALHRRAFESWGGVPRRVVLDNLKAAVLKAHIYDPVLGEAYRRLAQHYGFVVSPTRPATPEHKGKVESGVHYVKRNFMAGQEFVDIQAANRQLAVWVKERAGTRVHGTTRQVPLRLFQDHEQRALLPLPTAAFELIDVRLVTVHPDCHVALDGSYYSVSYLYIGQTLEAYIGERVVQLFHGRELLATHPRAAHPGQWQTRLADYPRGKAAYLERTPERCREIATRVGPATHRVVDTLLAERPLDRLRTVQAILRLEETVGAERLEAACRRALHFGDPRYRRIKDILNAALDREPVPDTATSEPARPFAFARASAEFFEAGEEVARC